MCSVFTLKRIQPLVWVKAKVGILGLLSLPFLVFAITSCTTNYGQGGTLKEQSPEFGYIQEYAFSPNNTMLAIVVPFGEYSERLGMENSQILVLDTKSFEILYDSQENSGLAPRNLQWSSDNNKLLFIGNGLTGRSLITWELEKNLLVSAPFYHAGFAISYAGDKIITWGELRETGTGFLEVLTGRLETYSLPNFEKGESILVEHAIDVLRVAWATDDLSVMALAKTSDESGDETRSIYKINLSTREQNPVSEGVPILSDFAWDSANNLIAFTRNNMLNLYDAERNCYVYETQYSANRLLSPAWKNSGMTVAFIEDDVSRSQVVALDFDGASLPYSYECLSK